MGKSIRSENKDMKVLLMSAVRTHGLNLKIIEALFLPKNTTSKFQPLDALFKRKYKAMFLHIS